MTFNLQDLKEHTDVALKKLISAFLNLLKMQLWYRENLMRLKEPESLILEIELYEEFLRENKLAQPKELAMMNKY